MINQKPKLDTTEVETSRKKDTSRINYICLSSHKLHPTYSVAENG